MKKTNKIRVLSENVANLIAAGEVVERPASVIKELIENAVDAGAQNIDVVVKQAGLKLMRVTDDGEGMQPGDARLAFVRHATSKIFVPEDLNGIRSLGFRGEALPSIAAVSKVELLTRPHNEAQGLRLCLHGGRTITDTTAGCAPGTAVSVCDLFYNTPARRKFLKSEATEQARIVQIVEWMAMAQLPIRFRMEADGKEIINCPRTTSLHERLQALYGKSLPQSLLPVEFEAGGIWVRGLIADPSRTRNNRQDVHLFVNHRPVEHRGIFHAVLQAYRPMIAEGRFPFCYIFLDVPPERVDVNVHPGKREVRFQDEHALHEVVEKALKASLKNAFSPSFSPSDTEAAVYPQQESFKNGNVNFKPISQSWSALNVKESIARYMQSPSAPLKGSLNSQEDNRKPLSDPLTADIPEQIFGQVGRMYLLGQDSEGIFIIDQHAAHERMIYESLKNRPGPLVSQALLIPITFDVSPTQAILIRDLFDFFNTIGLEITELGGYSFAVHTQPAGMMAFNPVAAILDILDGVAEYGQFSDSKVLMEGALKRIACHGAIKAGERLQPEIMHDLIQLIHREDMPKTCPHGRPFVIRMTWDYLEKIFKRK